MRSLRSFLAQDIARPRSTRTLAAANTIIILALGIALVFLVILSRSNLNLTQQTTSLKSTVATMVFGLSIDPEDAKEELSKLDRNFDLLLLQSKPIQRAYRIVAIPLVLLVSPQGTVEWVHYGALSDERIKEILSLIDESE